MAVALKLDTTSGNLARFVAVDSIDVDSVERRSGSGDLVIGSGLGADSLLLGSATGAVEVENDLDVAGTLSLSNTPIVARGFTELTPTALSAQANNYDPAGFGTADTVRQDLTGSQTITGFAAPGVGDNEAFTIINIDGGSDGLTLANDSASSVAANRIITGTGADVELAAGRSASLRYDTTSSRWRVLSTPAAEAASERIVNVRVVAQWNVDLATELEAGDVIDNVTLATGDLVLLADQTDTSENGIYIVPASGAASRWEDFDEASDFQSGTLFAVHEGHFGEGTLWYLRTHDPTVDTDDIHITEVVGTGDRNHTFWMAEDFYDYNAGVDVDWQTRVGGGGVFGNATEFSDGNHPGTTRHDITSVNDYATLRLSAGTGGGAELSGTKVRLKLECMVYIETLPDSGADDYSIRFGLGDNLSGDFTDGVYVETDDTNHSGAFVLKTAQGGTRTTSATFGTLSTGWNHIKVFASSARCFAVCNKVKSAENTTNIPTGSSQNCNPHLQFLKTVGSGNSELDTDFVSVYFRWIGGRE